MLTFYDIPRSIFNNQRRLVHYHYRSGAALGAPGGWGFQNF